MTEEMMRAAREMNAAADEMKKAASWYFDAVSQQRAFLEDFMSRFEQLVESMKAMGIDTPSRLVHRKERKHGIRASVQKQLDDIPNDEIDF